MNEQFSEPELNVIASTEGFSVKVLGQVGLRYIEGTRSVWIDSEVLAKPRTIAISTKTIRFWEGPEPGQVSEKDRNRIVSNVKRAFEACGYELQVQEPFDWTSEAITEVRGVADRKGHAIDRMRSAIDNFLGELRTAEGLKSSSYAELRDSIIELGAAWAEEDTLPKLVVNYLLGLYSWIDSASYGYVGEEAESIRRAAGNVEELIFVHVVPASQEDP